MKSFQDLLNVNHQKFCFDNLPQKNTSPHLRPNAAQNKKIKIRLLCKKKKTLPPELKNPQRIMLGWVGGWG